MTAPILAVGVAGLLAGRAWEHGAVAPGEVFDAGELLSQLSDDLEISWPVVADSPGRNDAVDGGRR